ncbi:MAG: Asp-tRNA(Asn)/Glu-tRNA(Gln) amidotransferase subunit GatC [Clostridium sp.]|jgi:aspartyl-tRNA(Asn)/glutamyl-tRNA(Gln) amidotransferase subunit C|nr:Asp-tRNA(Asn)/Glu-tRNA(Gln) amidotransferase subunit GatC [Clostridium sp.]
MANHIDDATMEYVGILAKLDLSNEEKETAKRDMERMLNYIDELNELDTTGVTPLSHVLPATNVFRDDEVVNGDIRDEILQNAPGQKDGMFKVPRIVE